MDRIINSIGINGIVTLVLILISVGLYACAPSHWKTVIKPPSVDPVHLAESLNRTIASSVGHVKDYKQVVGKILYEVKSKLPLIEDGQITVGDAFSAALSVAPVEYKPLIITMKAVFAAVVGDIGKEIPKEFRAKIEILRQVIDILCQDPTK